MKIITPDALNNFIANFEYFIRGIANDDEEVLDELLREDNFIESNIKFKYTPLNKDGDFNETDYRNIKIFYDTFKDLTPVQASQERVWVSLTLCYYLDYYKYRTKSYLNNLINDIDVEKSLKGLKSSILFTQGQKRSLFIGRLSRLWWTGYLTYDNDNDYPYHLTKFFSENDYSGRAVLYFSSNYTANKSLSLGILSALKDFNNKVKINRVNHLVPVTKYFNTLGGGSLIDLYSREDAYEITEKFLLKIDNEKV